MAKIGEIKTAPNLGYIGGAKYVWDACPDCNRERWQLLSKRGRLCRSCAALRLAREKAPVTCTDLENPKVGDTTRAKLLGYPDRGIRYFEACPKCNRTRWVRKSSRGSLCLHCVDRLSGSQHPRWVEGRKTKRGYVLVLIGRDDPFYKMARSGWVPEHRLVAARMLGRVLKPREVVHHINGNKSDNRECNLKVLPDKEHSSHLALKDLQEHIRALEARVLMLEDDNVLLIATLSRKQDGASDENIGCHNTLGRCSNTPEGIVQSTSDGEVTHESE